MKRNFISILDWTTEEIRENLSLAHELKTLFQQRQNPPLLDQRSYALIFHKNSLRTRVAFEVGIFQLGGHAIHLTEHDFTLGKRETVHDVAKVMSRLVDGILIRTFDHKIVVELGEHAEVPVVNMLTDWSHPCQIMADVLTVQEKLGTVEGKKIVYLGDGNNVAHSWINLAARLPIRLCIATSKDSLPDMDLFRKAQEIGVSELSISHDPLEAVREADVIYTDVWASMGQKDLAGVKADQLQAFQLNQRLMDNAKPTTLVMHCLPAERGREITDAVLDGSQSVVLDQAENRLHAQKAILVQLDRWSRQT